MRASVLLLAAAMLTSAVPVARAASVVQDVDEVLMPGHAVWWDGAAVTDEVNFWELCDVEAAAPCYHYNLTVAEGGERLRVALDFQDRESRYAFRVRPPGVDAAPVEYDPLVDTGTENVAFPGPTTIELTLGASGKKPIAAGSYLVSVAPLLVEEDSFRLRAVLEDLDAKPTPGGGNHHGHGHAPGQVKKDAPRALLPNIKAVPPYGFTFDAALDGRAKVEPPTFGSLGLRESCNADERTMYGARVCLRFAAGGFNAGEGPLRIAFDATRLEGRATQLLRWTDGTWRPGERDAGGVWYHTPHRHQHYEEALVYRLHRVVDPDTGSLEAIGTGHKTGYCMTDYVIADWFSTEQDAAFTGGGSNCGSVENYPFVKAEDIANERFDPAAPAAYEGRIGWTRGWGDIYPNWKEGQYVEFAAAAADGLYLVTTHFDHLNRLDEATKADNAAYAYIRISGYDAAASPVEPALPRVDIIERGRGASPWDPDKVVVTGETYR